VYESDPETSRTFEEWIVIYCLYFSMFFFRKRSSVQSSAMCVINLRMFYFSLQLFVCDVTIGEAYVMQMCYFLKVISYKLLLHHQSNPL